MNVMRALTISRRGSIVLMTAVGAIFLIGLLAMVTDVGWMYYNQARLQTAVNAGWKAGIDKMNSIRASRPGPFDDTDRERIRQRVRDVMKENGYTDAELTQSPPVVTFHTMDQEIRVTASQTIGLFFARVLDFQNATVAARREMYQGYGSPLIPLLIPHAPTKDIGNVFICELFNADQGFASGSEYILKLGTGQLATGDVDLMKILIPMVPKGVPANNNDTSVDTCGQVESGTMADDTFLKAYGVAYWCLRIDGNDKGYLPVQWLLGYKRGSFLLPYDLNIVRKLTAMKVNFRVIVQTTNNDTVNSVQNQVTATGISGVTWTIDSGSKALDDIYKAVGSYVLELKGDFGFRPPIAVYSSQPDPDPVEDVLRAAQIPYGGYMPARTGSYDATQNSTLYDTQILNGALASYTWLHCHHEDFTGMTGGCYYIGQSCYDEDVRTSMTKTASNSTDLCPYCKNYYFLAQQGNSNSSYFGWGGMQAGNATSTKAANIPGFGNKTYTWSRASCQNYGVRCADKVNWEGKYYADIFATSIVSGGTQHKRLCNRSDYERPQCQSYKTNWTAATNFGFADDPNFNRSRKLMVNGTLVSKDPGNLNPLLPTDNDFVKFPSRVQKMKWRVARTIRQHVYDGGHLFSECFAPETLDVALWMARVYERNKAAAGQSPDNMISPLGFTAGTGDYDACLAGTGFLLRTWFWAGGPTSISGWDSIWTSSLNNKNSVTFAPFTAFPTDARCQTHDSTCSAGTGHTDSFQSTLLKTSIKVLHAISNSRAGYLKGDLNRGSFAFFGGHSPQDTGTRRLILNNVLLGAFASKEAVGEAGFGKQKNNFGAADMDNSNGGGANDYRDRLMYGYNSPIELSDRILLESGNMVGPTEAGINYHVYGDGVSTPSRRVIVPITDIPPEVLANPKNASATCLYDLQGTDHPDGVYDPASYTFGASPRIIGFAEFELIVPDEYERAGNNIQSGDIGDLGPAQVGQVRGRFVRYIVRPGDIPVN